MELGLNLDKYFNLLYSGIS